MALRARIRAELERRDWSERQASLKAGLGPSTLTNFFARVEHGGTLSSESARRLARLFGWPQVEILHLAGHQGEEPQGEGLALVEAGLRRLGVGEAERDAVMQLTRVFLEQRRSSGR